MEKQLCKRVDFVPHTDIEITLFEILDDPTSFVTIQLNEQKLHISLGQLFLLQKAVNKSVNSLLSDR